MKKICITLILLNLAIISFGQIQQVSYRGAFAPAPTAMWTEGWANWDPENTVYPAPGITVSGNISANTTWTSNNVYRLDGLVYVDSLVTLTIEPGTIIRGGLAPGNSSLIIKRGAKIIAEGTPCNPIVFTSGLAVGSRSRGDWGGLILLGRAQTNLPGGVGFIEGLSTNPQLGYGGNDNADNSGILKYVRIELNGSVFAPNSEINGLTMGSVGSGTKIDYVQVSFNQDDSFEWFGGSVNATHLVSYRNLDDDFDTDNGFSGKVQFCLAVRDPNVADNPTISTSEGFESDNDAGASVNTPQTSAVFSNVTVIGPYRGIAASTVASGFRRGARLRRNTALKIFNSIFMDYATGLFLDGPAAKRNALNGVLKYKNNIVALTTPTHRVAEDDSTRLVFFAAANSNDSLSSTTGVLVTPYNFTAPDYRPAAGSPALSNTNFNDPSLGTVVTPGTIQQVSYRGAFAPAPTAMWTEGWANWDPENTVYPAPGITVSGNISANTTWTSNNVYRLDGLVYVDSLVTLTIEPGTIIRGGLAPGNSSLIIKRGAKIIAEGTPCNPIVFTSGLAVGSRSRGDWGGLILLGRAQTNLPGGVGFIEGLSTNPQLGYGGNDNADNSGILKYVRIELNGSVFAPNSEINGLTMGSVGSGTKIDYVQVSFNQDDSFEWFGGSVNATHLVSYRNLDDDFDTDNGFSGKVQFCLAVRDPNVADNPTISTSEGFESDNDAGASVNTPQTSAVFSNVTVIGPYRGIAASTVASGFRRGARLRRNTALKIFNSIFMDYATGLFLDGPAAKRNALNGVLKYKNNIVALTTPTHRVAEDDSTRLVFFAAANSNDSLSSTAGILIRPYEFLTPDYRPAPASPALSNFDFTDQVLPITLVSFTGEILKNDNFLYWETSTEINNTGFEILRSINGQTYNPIGFTSSLALNGNSTNRLKYTFSDRNVRNEKSYYRLKQIDKNGISTLSNIVVLARAIPDNLRLAIIYPNPVTASTLNVEIASPRQQIITVVVNDAFGRKVFQNKINLLKGIINYQLNVRSMSAGNYFVTIIPSDGSANQVREFIKQ